MKKLSIIVACYNEAKNIQALHDRVCAVMQMLPLYDYELIFVDNASTDNSVDIFKFLVTQNQNVAVLRMSRNFGSNQPSLLAGMNYAQGDCIISIDGDLQDPPELIPAFVKTWQEGYDVVYGVRKRRKGSILRRIGYTCFYRIFRMLSYLDIPLDAGDTCLIDRKVVNIITALPEKDIYLRGLRTWAGFRQIGVEYVREDRAAGVSSNSFFANFSWAKKAIVNFSYKPLEYISRLAACAVICTILAAGVYLYLHFKYGSPRGFATLLMTMFVFGSIQLLALSILGEYIMRIFQEVKGRPLYIIETILTNASNQKTEPPPFAMHGARIHATPTPCCTCSPPHTGSMLATTSALSQNTNHTPKNYRKCTFYSLRVILPFVIASFATCNTKDIYKPFTMDPKDLAYVLKQTISTPAPQTIHLPADITYGCADIKYKDGRLVFCECGDSVYMSFRTASVTCNQHVQDLVSPYWGVLWHYIKQFNVPFWLVENSDEPHALALDEMMRLGGRFSPHLKVLAKDPLFQRLKENIPKHSQEDRSHLKNYKGIVVYRSHCDLTRDSREFEDFKKRNPHILCINAFARKHLKRKDATYKLLHRAGLEAHVPAFKIYQSSYQSSLHQQILSDFDHELLIVKPVFSSLSMGVNTVDRNNLDSLLHTILHDYKNIPFDAHRSLSFWRDVHPPQFLVSEYVPSKTIMKDHKSYDPTMRVVFIMHHDHGTVYCNVIAGFWKIPVKSLDDPASLTDQHVTIAHAGSYFSGILVDNNDWAEIKKILHTILPTMYVTMLEQEAQVPIKRAQRAGL